jgi:hypothetical protein
MLWAKAALLGSARTSHDWFMWLLSARTALSLIGAAAGVVLAREFTGLSPFVAVIVGALAGSALAGLALSPVADRIDRTLHRMGGPSRFRR